MGCHLPQLPFFVPMDWAWGVWLPLALVPFTYGFVGWVTNWLALKMTFYPIQFMGIPPYLGWQGIIPRKADKMVGKSVDVITERLMDVREVFQKVDAKEASRIFTPVLEPSIRKTVKEFSDSLDPNLWPLLPDFIKEEIYQKVNRDSQKTMKVVVQKLQRDIDSLFDVRSLVLKKLSGDNVRLVVDIFQKVGAPEFRFIERSGFYFGFLLGMVQMIFMIFYPVLWTLPIQGIIVGYLTNYLALQMIFRPLYPKQFFGLFEYQGMFLKRQKEVAEKYAELVSDNILTPKNILEELVFGKASNDIAILIEKQVIQKVDEVSLLAKPFLFAVGKHIGFEETKHRMAQDMASQAIRNSAHLEEYLGRALDLKQTMGQKMANLPPEEFESILRSAFQEDEWLLILVGAVLGALVGWFQMVFYV